ncbi:LPD7 domain-containing protein [Erwinia amylovora]|uniref:LPD7 domain-containing protein n=1 Tax=Erwinia amylovora TaxID=552 RepID=UPI00144487E5|nr:LPD7 domain-containing protein [Erwinia amylovora]
MINTNLNDDAGLKLIEKNISMLKEAMSEGRLSPSQMLKYHEQLSKFESTKKAIIESRILEEKEMLKDDTPKNDHNFKKNNLLFSKKLSSAGLTAVDVKAPPVPSQPTKPDNPSIQPDKFADATVEPQTNKADIEKSGTITFTSTADPVLLSSYQIASYYGTHFDGVKPLPDGQAIHFKDKTVIEDTGQSLSVKGVKADTMQTSTERVLLAAKAKGWEVLTLDGMNSKHVEEAYREAIKQGFKVKPVSEDQEVLFRNLHKKSGLDVYAKFGGSTGHGSPEQIKEVIDVPEKRMPQNEDLNEKNRDKYKKRFKI